MLYGQDFKLCLRSQKAVGQRSYRKLCVWSGLELGNHHATVILELHSKLATAIDGKDAWYEKYAHFTKSIDSVLDQCNTVKQLLEVWPGAEALLPNDVIQKLHTKVTRKVDAEKVRDLSQFDADAANQVLLTSSLLGD